MRIPGGKIVDVEISACRPVRWWNALRFGRRLLFDVDVLLDALQAEPASALWGRSYKSPPIALNLQTIPKENPGQDCTGEIKGLSVGSEFVFENVNSPRTMFKLKPTLEGRWLWR
jgi:hypothetical protein